MRRTGIIVHVMFKRCVYGAASSGGILGFTNIRINPSLERATNTTGEVL